MGVPGIPSEAEVKIVLRDIHLAARTGCAVHIQHVSTKEAVEALRAARARGVRISAEATPHHLALVDSDVPALGVNGKMNPPLRSATDREAILSGVADGTLEAFASDHAPHTPAAKSAPFATAPFGVIGLETAVGVTYTVLVQSGLLTLAEWIQRWTAGPARILGRNPPTLAPGRSADIVLLDIEHPWTVRTAEFLSLSRNTPFEDCELYGRAVRTLLRGICTWAEEGAPGNTPAD
jgi:dihydroorotase